MAKLNRIASVMSKINLPSDRVKKRIGRRDSSFQSGPAADDVAVPGFEQVSWRFAHIPVTGEIEIVFANRLFTKFVPVTIPVKAVFLAACFESRKTTNVMFGASLS